jgi:hypothetical protein
VEKGKIIKKLSPLLPEATIVTAVIATTWIDTVNNQHPHIYDRISPLIENHWGNITPSLLYPLLIFKLLNIFRHTEIKRAAQIGLFATLGANVLFETLTKNNSEFAGDVIAGTAAALVTYGILTRFKKPS